MNKDKKFNGNRVFLALRTGFYDKKDEHLTLRFLGNEPKWEDVISAASEWQSRMPIGIKQCGFAVWKNRDLYHEVALMEFDSHPSLFGRNWHITLDSSAEPITVPLVYQEENYWEEHDTLWVGYKDTATGDKKWITYKNAKHLVKDM